MIEWKVETRPWLSDVPKTFHAQCAEVCRSTSDQSDTLRALANHRLNSNQLELLASTLLDAQKKGVLLHSLSQLRLGLVSNTTTALITPALVATALRFGILLNVVEADFGQVTQEALDPNSTINRAQLDAVLLALDHRGLPFRDGFERGLMSETKDLDGEAVAYMDLLREQFARGGQTTVIMQTLPAPSTTLFGSYEYRMTSFLRRQTELFNNYLANSRSDTSDLLLDVAGLANLVGLDKWHDPRQWYMAKLPFSQKFVPLYADFATRLMGSLRGKSRKCLVLDLDNTLWGGVIGDDGLEGICLGQGSPMGEAFLDIQRMALDLRKRGVILAVCSKNEEENARLPFKKHPEMILKEEHIALFQANWRDKASNLEEIAHTLNIGLDALVLLDDNPVERAQVREALPEVAVPELLDDPAYFPRAVLLGGYFESVGFTADDRLRADTYQANAKRATLQKNTRNLDEFLDSLNMKASFLPFDALNRGRIAQLINKTNQFNLTTRRYTESQVKEMESDASLFTLQTRLRDRFGDNGIISVVICRTKGSEWIIDTWLMSCRVLKRRVEERVLEEIVNEARRCGITSLVGEWIPSGRNDLVKEHYPSLGFQRLDEEEGLRWRLSLDLFTPLNPPIETSNEP